MWYYEVASLESSCGIYGWWYSSSEYYPIGSAVTVELRDKIVSVIIFAHSEHPSDPHKSYKPIISPLTIVPVFSPAKIELMRSLARRMCVSLSKVLSVFITKDVLDSCLSMGNTLEMPYARMTHISHLSEGMIHIVPPDREIGVVSGVHIFPYFDPEIFHIDSILQEHWVDDSTLVRRRKAYHMIRTLSDRKLCVAGDRHLLQFPIESFDDIYWYFPHLKPTLSHQLIEYRMMDILEMYRIYTGARVHIVAHQLSPYMISLYHHKRFLLIDS